MNELDAGAGWQDLWLGNTDTRTGRDAGSTGATGRAESRDGSISVTVGPSGQVEWLALDDRVRDLSGPQLAREIMMVMRCARARIPAAG
ncbi:hypothetical protein [Actinoplanes teichomyceticus]|uniref:YbaB/EbfC DNA-binding family protein n=1 Tax=Actinoplanes teichomyceticus TaxID=1867 RepID=A0A561VID9_ACTTI|nr:hypothetical protein [Actinoplanes teichomyceticus]TWG11375.1 hypothetical protein FHX34_106105 [Actinoplanes teichomyceticus]